MTNDVCLKSEPKDISAVFSVFKTLSCNMIFQCLEEQGTNSEELENIFFSINVV